MDAKLRRNIETLKSMGKDQKQAREPLLKNLVDRVFADMLNEIQLGTVVIDLTPVPRQPRR